MGQSKKKTALLWRQKNFAKIQKYNRQHRKKNPDAITNGRRANRYKNAPYSAPTHCEACGNLLLKPCLDHCHLTGLFRGWLCRKCNSALGLAGDTPEAVQKLLVYITQAYEQIHKRVLS
jgi:hypothetical protein